MIWNVGTAELITEIGLPDIPLSAAWNWDGSKLVASCKDKKIRLLDPRTGNVDKVILPLSYIYSDCVFSFQLLFLTLSSFIDHSDHLSLLTDKKTFSYRSAKD